MTAEAERKAIQDLWPEHTPHLVPAENRMGQPYTDTEHGIVCNCGDVLGWPEDAPRPAEVIEVVEHQYNAATDWSAMAGGDTEDAVPLAEPPEDECGNDPADEAQATFKRRPIQDVQLPEITRDPEDLAQARTGAGEHVEQSAADVSPVLYQGNPQDIDAVRQFAAQAGVAITDDPPGFDGQLPARPTGVAPVADPLSDRVTIIDPTLPYGPEQVEHQLLRIEGQIERGIHFQRFWEERLHYAKVAFELANAQALIAATGGDASTRKAQALLACEQEYLELAVCETMVKSIRECMHNLRSLQTGYQTISNSVGATMRSRPYGA